MYIQSFQRVPMAIISIPTSIGGVAIPGGLISGPLGRLFGNNKKSQLLQYPSDLASNPARAHSVQISVKRIQPVNTSEKVNTVINDITNGVSKNIQATLKPPIGEAVATIALYMPDTLNMTYSSNYEDFNLTDAMGVGGKIAQSALDAYEGAKEGGWKEGVKNLANGGAGLEAAGAVLDKFGGTQNAGDVLLRATGKAVNPQVQLMYKGISLRTFQLDFIFTPKTKQEAAAVKNIIKVFTENFVPELAGAAKGNEGQYFVMPAVFGIKFLFAGNDGAISSIINNVLGNLGSIGSALAPLLPGNKGKENENIFKVGDCVLENMSVDYAPNGWASYSDGTPVQTKLSLSFKEMDIMHRDRVIRGDVR